VRGSDNVSLSGGTASFASKTAGTTKTVSVSGLSLSGTDAGNYQLASSTSTSTADITARALSVSATGANRVYDGHDQRDDHPGGQPDSPATASLPAIPTPASPARTSAPPDININGISIAGTDAGNYTANTTATATADITARSLSVSATGVNKVYDGTTSATVNPGRQPPGRR
jgi:hypothetical protein